MSKTGTKVSKWSYWFLIYSFLPNDTWRKAFASLWRGEYESGVVRELELGEKIKKCLCFLLNRIADTVKNLSLCMVLCQI